VGSVESNPALRDVPGIPHSLRLDDILPASGKLDNEFAPRRAAAWRCGRGGPDRSTRLRRQATGTAAILGCGVKLARISAIGCNAFFGVNRLLLRNFHKCE
jgi:hypothetical protein